MAYNIKPLLTVLLGLTATISTISTGEFTSRFVVILYSTILFILFMFGDFKMIV